MNIDLVKVEEIGTWKENKVYVQRINDDNKCRVLLTHPQAIYSLSIGAKGWVWKKDEAASFVSFDAAKKFFETHVKPNDPDPKPEKKLKFDLTLLGEGSIF